MGDDSAPNIDLNPHDWLEVRRILRAYVPEYEVWAFGSRAKWEAKPYSDLDLAILTDRPLSLHKVAELRSALDESTLPIKVDVVDWAATSESFRTIIEADKVVVLRPAAGLSGWTFKRLIDCTRDGVLPYGIVQPGQHDAGGIPIVRVNNISTGQLHVDDPMRVSPEIEANYQRTRLEGGEVLLTVVGTTGQTAVVPMALAGWNVARAVAVIRVTPDIGARWIHICLQSKAIQQFLDERANTTVQKTLNLSDVKEVLIPIPPPIVKDAIESVAVALDDKIELNRRMNATLEAMARALFQSWFVDFDPVRAKLDGRSPAAFDPATAALFPAHFDHNADGLVPTGWRATTLAEVIEISDSKRIPLSGRERETRQGKYPYHGAASVMDYVDDFLFDGIYALMGEDGSVINGDGTPVLQYVWGKFWVNNHAHVLRGRNGVSTEHLVLHLKGCNIAPFVTGAVQPKLNQGNMNRIPFMLPPPEIGHAFAKTIEPLFAQIRANTDQSRTLATLRETLLPKLLSGELCVAGLESKLAGAVAESATAQPRKPVP